MSVVGAAIGISVAYGLNAPPLVLFSSAAVGMAGNEFGSIAITIEGDNGYEGVTNISEEELIQISDNSYTASKNEKRYSFVFNDSYMTLTIENTDNTTTKGELPKKEQQ